MAAYSRPGNCYLIYIISQNRGQISASAQNGTAQISEKTGQCRCYISGSLQKVNARSMLIQCTFNARSYVQCTFNVRSHVRTFNARSMHVKCAFNAFTMRTSVVMRFLCAYNAFSVREIRILRVKYVFCTREIRILRVKYVFYTHGPFPRLILTPMRSMPILSLEEGRSQTSAKSRLQSAETRYQCDSKTLCTYNYT